MNRESWDIVTAACAVLALLVLALWLNTPTEKR
jgi:hypothetical protein